MSPVPEKFVNSILEKIEIQISIQEFKKIVADISNNINSIKTRAEFIYHLTSNNFTKFHSINYPLLKNNNNIIIPEDVTAFTPSSSNIIATPDFVSIDIIEKDLYNALISLFKESFNAGEPEARELQRIIKTIVNVQPYDITNITKQIISGTKDELNNLRSYSSKDVIIEMVSVLYKNKLNNPDQQSLKEKIPLLNKLEEVINNDDLVIGEDYHSGQFTSDIFEGIYSNENYLAAPNIWILDNDEAAESFFIWLGVNKSLKFTQEKDIIPTDSYQQYVFKHTRKPDKFNRPSFTGASIKNVEVLKKLEPVQLILLIEKERLLKTQLSVDQKDVFKYKYGSGYPKQIDNVRSFIEFQLIQNSSFNNYIVDDEIGLINFFKQIDYSDPLFVKYQIDAEDIKWTIRKLGAINSLNDISIDQFYILFDGHESHFLNGKGSQTFYKKFLDFCTRNKQIDLKKIKDNYSALKCFARKGGKGSEYELKPVSEVFYSDNNIVPQNILNEYWIINLPKRLGEQNVKKYFGVNLIQDELKNIEIKKLIESDFNAELNKYINRLKPYFLCYRLSSLQKKTLENEVASSVNNLEVKLVNSCFYTINNNEKVSLIDDSFIKIDNVFILKCKNVNSLDDLKNTPSFCDAIAEILCIQFKVKDHKNNFRAIFKDYIAETEHLIISDEFDEYLKSAKKNIRNFN